MRKTHSMTALFFLSAATMAGLGAGACGSSDGTPTPGPDGGDPDAIRIERPVTIVSLSPADGDDNVAVQAPITVTFSGPVKVGESPASVVGEGSAIIATKTELSQDRKTLTITPVSPLTAPGKLSVTLREITNVVGLAVVPRPWSWTMPRWLRVGDAIEPKGDPSVYGGPALTVGPGSRINVASYDGTLVVKAVDTHQGDWTQIGGSMNGGQAVAAPNLLVDKDGALVAAFVDQKNHGRIQRLSGNAWSDLGEQLGLLSSDGIAAVMRAPSIVSDSSGKYFVAYAGPNGDRAGVFVKTFANGSWSQLGGAINDTADSVGYVGIALNLSGVPYVLYTGGSQAYVRSWTGNAWAPVGSSGKPTDETTISKPSIAVDDAGNAVVSGCFEGGYLVRRIDRGVWGTVGERPRDGCGGANNSFLARARAGHLFAFSMTGADTLRTADVTSTGWTAVEPPAITPPARAKDLAIDPEGTPVVTWTDNSSVASIHVGRLNR